MSVPYACICLGLARMMNQYFEIAAYSNPQQLYANKIYIIESIVCLTASSLFN